MDIKTDITKCLIHKYTNTNTQIQHMTKCQKDPRCGIFLKRGFFKDSKNYIPRCRTHKYKNTNTKYKTHTSDQREYPAAELFQEDLCASSLFQRMDKDAEEVEG